MNSSAFPKCLSCFAHAIKQIFYVHFPSSWRPHASCTTRRTPNNIACPAIVFNEIARNTWGRNRLINNKAEFRKRKDIVCRAIAILRHRIHSTAYTYRSYTYAPPATLSLSPRRTRFLHPSFAFINLAAQRTKYNPAWPRACIQRTFDWSLTTTTFTMTTTSSAAKIFT